MDADLVLASQSFSSLAAQTGLVAYSQVTQFIRTRSSETECYAKALLVTAILCSYLLCTCTSHLGGVPSEKGLGVHGHLSFHSRDMTNSTLPSLSRACSQLLELQLLSLCSKLREELELQSCPHLTLNIIIPQKNCLLPSSLPNFTIPQGHCTCTLWGPELQPCSYRARVPPCTTGPLLRPQHAMNSAYPSLGEKEGLFYPARSVRIEHQTQQSLWRGFSNDSAIKI